MPPDFDSVHLSTKAGELQWAVECKHSHEEKRRECKPATSYSEAGVRA